MNLELQQRSTEYSLLLAAKFTNLRSELLSKMPVLDESAVKRKKQSFTGGDMTVGSSSGNLGGIAAPTGNSGSLLDLDDIFGLGANTAPVTNNKPVTNTTDLLSDIFAVNTTISPNPLPVMGNMGYGGMPPVTPTFNNMAPMMGMNQGMMNNMVPNLPTMNQQSAVVSPAAIKAFDKNGLQILIEMLKPVSSQPSKTKLLCKFVNLTSSPMDSLVFQAAVPKYLKLEMAPPSSLIIPSNSNGTVTQEINLDNSMQGEKPIMLKLKIGYNQNGNKVEELAQVSSFPANY
jgi:AP-1 complex subunit gamma-1